MTIKLFFFDLEGTLIANRDDSEHMSLWGRIAEELGESAVTADEDMYEKYERGEYPNYLSWASDSLLSFQKHGLTNEILDRLLDEAIIREGVIETVKALHEKGITTAIISGGFHEQAARLQRQLGIRHAFTAVQIYWGEDGTIETWNALPANEEGKIDFVELMRREFHITRDECAFVGNGRNDIPIAGHVGLSFAVHDAHPKLKETTTHTLNKFTDILKYV